MVSLTLTEHSSVGSEKCIIIKATRENSKTAYFVPEANQSVRHLKSAVVDFVGAQQSQIDNIKIVDGFNETTNCALISSSITYPSLNPGLSSIRFYNPPSLAKTHYSHYCRTHLP